MAKNGYKKPSADFALGFFYIIFFSRKKIFLNSALYTLHSTLCTASLSPSTVKLTSRPAKLMVYTLSGSS